MKQVGTRVGAILWATPTKVALIGFGVLVEREPPGPEAEGWMAEAMREKGIPNVTILLDDGSKVWGCECWWATEPYVHETIGAREIVPAPRGSWAGLEK